MQQQQQQQHFATVIPKINYKENMVVYTHLLPSLRPNARSDRFPTIPGWSTNDRPCPITEVRFRRRPAHHFRPIPARKHRQCR